MRFQLANVKVTSFAFWFVKSSWRPDEHGNGLQPR